eukprot:3811464-Prymnesium_polylepis.4
MRSRHRRAPLASRPLGAAAPAARASRGLRVRQRTAAVGARSPRRASQARCRRRAARATPRP